MYFHMFTSSFLAYITAIYCNINTLESARLYLLF